MNYHNYFVGSCGIHVVYKAFQTRVDVAGCWELEKVFKAMW